MHKSPLLLLPLLLLLTAALVPTAALAAGVPDFVPLPPGYALRANTSRESALDHETFAYPPERPGQPWHRINVEGRGWRLGLRAKPPQKKKREEVFATFLPVLEGAGWKVLRREGLVVAHLEAAGHDAWLTLGGSSSEDVSLVILERQSPPARPR
jgi:hypothetical protein